MKICSICKVEKPLSKFTVSGIAKISRKKYYKSFCKSCFAEYAKQAKGRSSPSKFTKGFTPWNKGIPSGVIPWNKAKVSTKYSTAYREWSKNVRERDNYTCQECFSIKSICAHHIKPWKENIEKRFDLDNGITLCNSCHSKIHHKIGSFDNLEHNGMLGKKHSLETRTKMRLAHSKRTSYPTGMIPWNKGKSSWSKGLHLSEEHRKNIGKALAGKSTCRKGLHLPKEHRQNISEALKGRKLSKEHTQKISDYKKGKITWMKGKKHSDETRAKMRKAWEKRKLTSEDVY